MKLILLLSIMLSALTHAKINIGDTLSISIKGVPQEEQGQINGDYPVSKAGKIHLPFLSSNPISASGLSTAALARKIEAAYKSAQIYTTPTISIQSLNDTAREKKKVNEAIQKYFTISGEVGSQGPKPYRPGLKLIDVVSGANPSPFAALHRVELLRDGKNYVYNMKVPAEMLVEVAPDDQIKVKPKNWIGQ